MIEPSPAPDKLRISILERVVPMTAFALATIGGGTSAFLLSQVLSALREAEMAGVASVSAGIAESNVAALTGLYLSILVGFFALGTAVLRMFTAKTRSSPPGFFYLFPGLLALLPATLLWYAESLIIEVLLGVGTPGSGGMASIEATLTILLIGAMVAVPFILVVLALFAFFPFSARPGGKIGPTIALLIIGLLFIATAVAFQYRTMFLYRLRDERGARPSVILHT
jgi:hypothetical protein